MKNYIRNNSKAILAVLGVILMIAWVLPSGNKMGSGSGISRQLVGYAGDRKVYDTDLSRAKQQWDFIQEIIRISPEQLQGRSMGLMQALAQQDPNFARLANEISNHPEMYFLLQLEADRMGVIVTPADVEREFRGAWAVQLPTRERQVVQLSDVTDPVFAEEVKDAAISIMKVFQAMDRARTTVKVSEPLRRQQMARQLEQIQVGYVKFAAADLLSQVAKPTPEQLQAHFDKFSNFEPEQPPSPENPHAFGYKFPNRVTLQYIGVRHDDVRDVIRATKTAYEWEVDAQKYYLKHKQEFPATKPTSLPTSMAAATAPAGPTTKPFEEVRDRIIDQLMNPEIARKARDAQDRISTALKADWDTWHAAHPTTSASTQQSGEYATFEYLKRIASEVQKDTGVLPFVAAVNQLESAKELRAIADIGNSFYNQVPFADYATELSADIRTPTGDPQRDSVLLQTYQPSQVVKDPSNSTFVFRITGAMRADRPKSMDEVAKAVERDYLNLKAYESAKLRADGLIEGARAAGSLDSGATAANLKMTRTGMFEASSPTIDGLPLEAAALSRFRVEALGLLSVAATQPTGPALKVIELPVQNEVYAVQLLQAKPRIDIGTGGMLDAMIENELRSQAGIPIAARWFSFDSVASRMKWQDQSPKKNRQH